MSFLFVRYLFMMIGFLCPLIFSTDPLCTYITYDDFILFTISFSLSYLFTLVIPRLSYPYRAGSPKLQCPRLLHLRRAHVPTLLSFLVFYLTRVVL